MSGIFLNNHICSPELPINSIVIIIVIGPSYAKCPNIICGVYKFPWGGGKRGGACIVGGNQGLTPRLFLCLMLAKQTLAM